jgi:hypothetical protein
MPLTGLAVDEGPHNMDGLLLHVSEFSGIMRSDFTNAQRPIYLLAQDPNTANRSPVGPPQVMLPTLPDDTYGIPGLADFDITTQEKPFPNLATDGEPLSEFLRTFGPFTIILRYDGATIERHFTLEQIKAQVALLEKQAHPFDSSVPRATRKPSAPAVQMFPFMTPPSAPTQPPVQPTPPTDTQPTPKG